MKYLFELSKEHKRIPKYEVFSCLNAENINYKTVLENQDVIIIDSDVSEEKIKKISERLSYTFYVNSFLFKSKINLKEIKNKARLKPINNIGTVAIKHKNRSNSINSKSIIRAIADIYTKNKEVKLENPDNEIRVFITDNELYVSNKISKINRSQFEERKVQNRPFFSPISLHPKLARALVNLSGIKKNETLLDPFCGTGGFLIEAGLIGAKVIGSDIEEKMIIGCKKTLDFYKIKNYDLYCSDIGKINNKIKNVDSIVTDFPYGKSTTTKGEKMENLYNRAFENMSKILKKKGKAVIGLSDKDNISLGKNYFSLIDRYDIVAHRSLTRYFVLFQK